MKKFTTGTDLGGAPIYKNDLREVFNSEIWVAIEALLYQFNSDTQGIIVSGCVTTANGGNFDMTAGVVYLNGEFMRIPAAINQTFTKYIAPKAAINDSRTFADTTSHVITIDKQAELVGSAPGAGQYITIASLIDLDDRRLNRFISDKELKVNRAGNDTITGILTVNGGVITDNVTIKHKKFNINDWDMVTEPNYSFLHGLTMNKILDVSIMIDDNAGVNRSRLDSAFGAVAFSGYFLINATEIQMFREAGEKYDNATYTNCPIEVMVVYEP